MLGLKAKAEPTISDLEAAVGAVLDRRLNPEAERPLAVALSGGGDSLALLLAVTAWALRAGRRLIVLTVDHRLNPQSTDWTDACAATAERLNLPFRALAWEGEKPVTGLPAAARAARHVLLAEAAREAGASVILLGHTADDVAEARRMRAAGGSVPEPREWSPSPAWPEGRGVFLLRPLLDVSRAAIRAWLTARRETWIDDPANDDVRFARARARQAKGAPPSPPPQRLPAELASASRAEADGVMALPRRALRSAAPELARRFVSAACLCAGGGVKPPARDRAERLAARLQGDGAFVATLAGARITADADEVRFAREPGEAARGGLAPLILAAGENAVWDGRFEVFADHDVEVRAGRRGEPVGGRATFLGLDRLLAACGAVEREPA